jgi:hypothetical protein
MHRHGALLPLQMSKLPRGERRFLCMILHIGMHKNGNSSIQQALSFGLNDDRFRFVKLGGHANGSLIIGNAYADIGGYPQDPESPLALRRQARRHAMKIDHL